MKKRKARKGGKKKMKQEIPEAVVNLELHQAVLAAQQADLEKKKAPLKRSKGGKKHSRGGKK